MVPKVMSKQFIQVITVVYAFQCLTDKLNYIKTIIKPGARRQQASACLVS